MLKVFAFVVVALGMAAAATAQEMKIVSSPEVNIEASVPAGGEIYSVARIYTIQGAQLDADTKAGSWLLEQPVAAGTQLVPVETRVKFKACVPLYHSFTASGPCFLDDDGDGTFDRQAGDEAEMARKLKPPVHYSRIPVSIVREDSFKHTILFQGATSDSLRFSYREFSNDMARPAFTEELTIPREAFPAMIMIKNLQVEVIGVSGMGLRYRVVKVN